MADFQQIGDTLVSVDFAGAGRVGNLNAISDTEYFTNQFRSRVAQYSINPLEAMGIQTIEQGDNVIKIPRERGSHIMREVPIGAKNPPLPERVMQELVSVSMKKYVLDMQIAAGEPAKSRQFTIRQFITNMMAAKARRQFQDIAGALNAMRTADTTAAAADGALFTVPAATRYVNDKTSAQLGEIITTGDTPKGLNYAKVNRARALMGDGNVEPKGDYILLCSEKTAFGMAQDERYLNNDYSPMDVAGLPGMKNSVIPMMGGFTLVKTGSFPEDNINPAANRTNGLEVAAMDVGNQRYNLQKNYFFDPEAIVCVKPEMSEYSNNGNRVEIFYDKRDDVTYLRSYLYSACVVVDPKKIGVIYASDALSTGAPTQL